MLAELALDLCIMHDPTADLSLYLYIDYCDNKVAPWPGPSGSCAVLPLLLNTSYRS